MDPLNDVRSFLQTEFRVSSLAPDQNLLGAGILDSMGLLKLVAFLEERFGFEAGEGDIVPENFATLEKIRDYVERKTRR